MVTAMRSKIDWSQVDHAPLAIPASPSSIFFSMFSILRCSNVNRGYKNGRKS